MRKIVVISMITLDGRTVPAAFKLTSSKANSKGVIFAYYERAGDTKTG